MYMGSQEVLVNDTLNLLRGKLVRFILEDGDMRMIANLVATADELGLKYDPEKMVYRDVKAQGARSKSRAQLAKELEPGLNAIFGTEYLQHDPEAKRQETNRKAREKYHAKKKGKANGSKARKTSS
jgi:hypothetical protein